MGDKPQDNIATVQIVRSSLQVIKQSDIDKMSNDKKKNEGGARC